MARPVRPPLCGLVCILLALLSAGCLSRPQTRPQAHPIVVAEPGIQAEVTAVPEGSLVRWKGPGSSEIAHLTLPGTVSWLARHPAGDLVLLSTRIKRFSFGANYSVHLYRWDGQTPPAARLLYDTTLKPLTLTRWEYRLARLPAPQLSPQGEALALLRLHDPPAFDPYLRVILVSLDGPGELVVGSQSMPGAPLAFSADGEMLTWTEPGAPEARVWPWLGEAPGRDGTESPAAGALLELRRLRLQGLIGVEDYRRQWQRRNQP